MPVTRPGGRRYYARKPFQPMQRARPFVLLALLAAFAAPLPAAAQAPPKREFRGAWIATVLNLDWPSQGASAADQKSGLVYQLDQLKASGVNVVVFQVRPEADALYRSSIEPWSYYLTGVQGRDPGYDPLAFAVDEAHKRGMELHAWFNPYRAIRQTNTYPKAPNHVSLTHPEWILTFTEGNGNTLRIVDPGKQAARDYTARIVADVVRRYDIDGVHFDDYFYPYPGTGFPGITTQDDATFASEPRGFTDRGAWRRDNTRLFVKQVADSILAIRPSVKYGISPFGIWKNGVPSGIVGLDAYNVIYIDPVQWMQARYLDYLTPQLYWRFGGGQDYAKLAPWWKSQVNGRHFYPGLITSTNSIPTQIRFNRANGIEGSVLFRSQTVNTNTSGVQDSLRTRLHTRPALLPVQPWKETVAPNMPLALRQSGATGTRIALAWTPPTPAADGDTARYYALYRFTAPPAPGPAPELSENLVAVFGGGRSTWTDNAPQSFGAPYYYVLTALDANWNESAPSTAAVATDTERAGGFPNAFAIDTVYPNPTRGALTIRYRLDAPATVVLEAFDLAGRRVAVVEQAEAAAGVRQTVWDGRGASGAPLAPGAYVLVLRAGDRRASQTITIVR